MSQVRVLTGHPFFMLTSDKVKGILILLLAVVARDNREVVMKPSKAVVWREKAIKVIEGFLKADKTLTFCAEDVKNQIGKPPHPSVMASVFCQMRKQGKIRIEGKIKSFEPSRRGAKISTWVGV